MRRSHCLLGLIALFGTLDAAIPPVSEPDQVLHVRRISELWRSGEHDVAKAQVRDFLYQHPKSPYADSLMVLIGTHEWKEGDYAEALRVFDLVRTPSLRAKVLEQRLDCLYHLKEHKKLAAELHSHGLVPSGEVFSAADARHLFYWAEVQRADGMKQKSLGLRQRKLNEAVASYERLYGTTLGSQAKLGAAEILQATGHPDQAADLYEELAEALPDKRSSFLLKAAQLEAAYDRDRAANTLAKLQGTEVSWPLFSHVLTLFEAGQHQEVVDLVEANQDSLTDEQRPLVDYLLGRSYYQLKQYNRAIATLEPLLNNTRTSGDDKQLLIMLATSAYHADMPSELEQWTELLAARFPGDPAAPNLRYLLAQHHLKSGDNDAALELLLALEETAPGAQRNAQISYDIARIYYSEQRWRDAYHALEHLNTLSLSDELQEQVSKLIVLTTSHELKSAPKGSEERERLLARLTNNIEFVLKTNRSPLQDEQQRYRLQLAKTYYELGDLLASRRTLEKLLAEGTLYVPEEQVLTLLAYCVLKQDNDRNAFITTAEKALGINPSMPEGDTLRLHLVGAYMALAAPSTSEATEGAGNAARAADHLYSVATKNSISVPTDKLTWLGNFFYQQVNKKVPPSGTPVLDHETRELTEKALAIYERLRSANTLAAAQQQENSLRRAKLNSWLQRPQKVLEAAQEGLAIITMESAPDLRRGMRLRLALAQSQAAIGDEKNAKAGLSALAKNDNHRIDPLSGDIARLQLARIALQRTATNAITTDEQRHTRTQLLALQKNRQLNHEPVHLEAAWDGAHLEARLAPLSQQTEILLEALKEAKRDFDRQDDIVSRDYHAARKMHPDFERLYQGYMMLFDARIAELEAQNFGSQGRRHDTNGKQIAARGLYRTLSDPQFAPSQFLVDEAKLGLSRLAQQSGH